MSLDPVVLVVLVVEVSLKRGHGTLERRMLCSPLAAGLRPIPLWSAGMTFPESWQMTRPRVGGAPGSWAPGPAGAGTGGERGGAVPPGGARQTAVRAPAAERGTGARREWGRGGRECRPCACAVSSSVGTGRKGGATAPRGKAGAPRWRWVVRESSRKAAVAKCQR